MGPERRRLWRPEEKLAVLAEAFAPGVIVADVTRQRDVATSLIYQQRPHSALGYLTPRGVRGNLRRNGRSAAQPRPAPPIARCSAGAPAPISTRDSSPDWMNAGGHSNGDQRFECVRPRDGSAAGSTPIRTIWPCSIAEPIRCQPKKLRASKRQPHSVAVGLVSGWGGQIFWEATRCGPTK